MEALERTLTTKVHFDVSVSVDGFIHRAERGRSETTGRRRVPATQLDVRREPVSGYLPPPARHAVALHVRFVTSAEPVADRRPM
jgi:hypothetical protein